ncbi:MAG: single-stranded-DNA-specific exonuclease RecJ, partial [Deltaproteobacteria bacterium]|nr:single-stranded-DNA-specific exonuclease RecJ [Deltaproteobacteria bacterium]
FKKKFDEIVSSTLKESDRLDAMHVDAELQSDDITEELINELELLEPFGEGNPEPVFCLRELKVSDARIVAEKHLKLKITDDMVVLDAIGFGMGHHAIAADDILDVAFIPQLDTWRGRGSVQLKLKDMKRL